MSNYSEFYEKPPRVPYSQTLALVSQSSERRAADQCSACGDDLSGFKSPTARPLCAGCEETISVSEWDVGAAQLYRAASGE